MYLESLGDTWNRLGERDPMWAVLMNPGCEQNRWDKRCFFDTGLAGIAHALDSVRAVGFPLRRARAMDFGCGVGRLTQALACYFDDVVGVDIAPAMIRQARDYNPYGNRCRFLVNQREDLLQLADNQFDFIVSIIVLQHMRPQLAQGYIAEFMRVLAPGGLLLFQQPTHYSSVEVNDDEPPHAPVLWSRAERWLHRAYDRFSPPPSLPEVAGFDPHMNTRPRHAYMPPRLAPPDPQLPFDPPHPPGSNGAATATLEPWRRTELHTIRRWKMLAYLRRLGGRIFAIQSRNECGLHYPSLRYFVTK